MRAPALMRLLVWLLLAASALLVLADAGLFEAGRLQRGWRNVGVFVGGMLPPSTDGELLETLLLSLWETVRMAWAGTLLGGALALPLALLAAGPLAPPAIALPVRGLLAGVRTIPSILWAIFFIVIVGLGPLSGILALSVYTMGYLGKLFYEAIEAVDPEVLDATRATGASRFQVARHAVVPEAGNALLSAGLYAFEYNVRASSILGIVGAGGIGYYLIRFLDLFQYRSLATALILVFLVVLAVDALSRFVRRKYLLRRSG